MAKIVWGVLFIGISSSALKMVLPLRRNMSSAGKIAIFCPRGVSAARAGRMRTGYLLTSRKARQIRHTGFRRAFVESIVLRIPPVKHRAVANVSAFRGLQSLYFGFFSPS